MTIPTCSGYHFPRDVIQRAVWMYLRFTLSYRDVEDLLAERGIEVSYETVRRWVLTFGTAIARGLRARRPKPHGRWHLDEMFVRIGGRQMYLWRAVDAEGGVLDVLVQARRDKAASRKLSRPGATTGTEAAKVQVARIGAAVPLPACRHLQRLHPRPSPHHRSHAPALPSRGVCHVAGGGRRLGLTLPEFGLSTPTVADVTIPAGET